MSSRTWQLQDGIYCLEMHPGPIHYKALDGSWQPIDTNLQPTPKPGFAAASEHNALRSYIPQAADGWVRVEADETALAFQPVGANHGAAASVQGNRASLSGAFRHTDLSYEVLPGALKETLALSEHGDPSSFSFRFMPEGLTAVRNEDNSVSLNDAAGKTVLTIPAPFMTDAEGKASNAVAVTLNPGSEGWTYTMTPDPAWLSSAHYPVVLDPSISLTRDYSRTRVWNGWGDSGTPSDFEPGVAVTPDPPLRRQGDYIAVGRGTTESGTLYSWEGFLWMRNHTTSPPAGSVITDISVHLPPGRSYRIDGTAVYEPINVTVTNAVDDKITFAETIDPNSGQYPERFVSLPLLTQMAQTHPFEEVANCNDVYLKADWSASNLYNPELVAAFPYTGFYTSVQYAFPAPGPITVVSQDAFSIRLSIPTSTYLPQRQLQVYSDPDHTQLVTTVSVPTSNTSATVNALQPATKYYFVAVYSDGSPNNTLSVTAEGITAGASLIRADAYALHLSVAPDGSDAPTRLEVFTDPAYTKKWYVNCTPFARQLCVS